MMTRAQPGTVPVRVRASQAVHTAIARCGLGWELVHNQTSTPLDNTSTFSCLYHHPQSESSAGPCLIDGMGLGGHPSLMGSYLNALLISAQLTGLSPLGVWGPASIAQHTRQRLQHVAALAAEPPK
jgi:hypothetical protein|eukprot:COSAG01_NODE_4398_length_5066_cov_52.758204_3_plen_126_part_00